ncbi:MAG: hypothetical protein NVSMB34_09300 [Variovorax sp.]
MQLLFLATILAVAAWLVRSKDQGRRIALLGSHLGQYQIEKHMETLTQGYLRALGETDAQRSEQIWALLRPTEQALASQFERFAAAFAKVEAAQARVSRLPFDLPLFTRLIPARTFDLRRALAIHASGIGNAVHAQGEGQASARGKAYTLSAELFLMQHTCHWFCKSRNVASARMLARHQTSYEHVIASVAPATRDAYCSLLGRD